MIHYQVKLHRKLSSILQIIANLKFTWYDRLAFNERIETYHVYFVSPQRILVVSQTLQSKVETVGLCVARCSLTLASDLHCCRPAVPDVPWRRSRWIWRDVGQPRPPRFLSTDQDKPSVRPRDRDDLPSWILPHSSSLRCLVCLPAGRGGWLLERLASWSKWFDTELAELPSPPPRQPYRRRQSS